MLATDLPETAPALREHTTIKEQLQCSLSPRGRIDSLLEQSRSSLVKRMNKLSLEKTSRSMAGHHSELRSGEG